MKPDNQDTLTGLVGKVIRWTRYNGETITGLLLDSKTEKETVILRVLQAEGTVSEHFFWTNASFWANTPFEIDPPRPR
jgi:hypothetical protein